MRDAPNLNALHAALIIEELVRCGVTRAFIAPGARSAPLVAAIARHETMRATLIVDERAAGYAAVGYARATARPAVVVTTSGTAVANLLPAIVEASMDRIPLLALTADRPPELRECGANQTIRQRGIFSSYVRWETELPCPTPEVAARVVLTTIDHAVARATRPDPGPVHVDAAFREPLAPTPEAWPATHLDGLERWERGDAPFTTIGVRSRTRIEPGDIEPILEAAAAGARGVVLTGGLPIGTDTAPIRSLVERLGWPAIADARSGLRGGPLAARRSVLERLASPGGIGDYRPEVVLQLGSRLTSGRVLALARGGDVRASIVVDPQPTRLDPDHVATHRVLAHPDDWAQAVLGRLGPDATSPHARALAPLASRVRAALDAALDAETAISEPFVARHLTRHTPAGHGLFLSSSLPIREVDAFGIDDGPDLAVAANRGASGIDGVLAAAAGFTLGRARPVTLLVGDLALLHDASSLLLIAAERLPLTIVLLDNGGGGIFHFLPIAHHPDLLTPWFDTPHALDVAHLAASANLPHVRCETPDAFAGAYADAVASGAPSLLEVRTDRAENRRLHDRLDAVVREAAASGDAPR